MTLLVVPEILNDNGALVVVNTGIAAEFLSGYCSNIETVGCSLFKI